jgi:hypothetical protein
MSTFGDEDEASDKCDQCDSMTINGVYCHETGCPVRAQELRNEEADEY